MMKNADAHAPKAGKATSVTVSNKILFRFPVPRGTQYSGVHVVHAFTSFCITLNALHSLNEDLSKFCRGPTLIQDFRSIFFGSCVSKPL